MILNNNIVFIHIPKTAGNLLTKEVFLSQSPDYMKLSGQQDGVNRFEVCGPVTTHKHMSALEYCKKIDASEYGLIAVVRDSFERLLSLYFSPHNWLKPKLTAKGLKYISSLCGANLEYSASSFLSINPKFDAQKFKRLLMETRTQTELLNGADLYKSVDIIRYENIKIEAPAVFEKHGIKYTENIFRQRVNASSKNMSREQKETAICLFNRSRHKKDDNKIYN